jgi:hypothetical protein
MCRVNNAIFKNNTPKLIIAIIALSPIKPELKVVIEFLTCFLILPFTAL